MVTSCFFCQNLLSDFLEGILPSARHDEIRGHLNTCKACSEVHRDLQRSVELLKQLPSQEMSHDTLLRVAEASHSGKGEGHHRLAASRWAFLGAVPLLLLAAALFAFPQLFPAFTQWRVGAGNVSFNRYFPLYQGAAEILEEQASWLFGHEPMTGSLWEEGGLSPEEFEKTFQVNGQPKDNRLPTSESEN